MDQEVAKFGGPKELGGAGDLISHYKLSPHYNFFCKRSLPLSLSDSHYLHNVLGDTEIRKGEGMQLDQLIQNFSYTRDTQIQPFGPNDLREAFQFQDITPVELSPEEKGVPTFATKPKSESKEKERKHKKHKDRDKEKDREHKKHKHRQKHKDQSKDREKDKDREKKKDKSGHHNSGGDHSKKHHEKKRKHDGDEDLIDVHRHKKSKHKSSKLDEMGAIKVAG